MSELNPLSYMYRTVSHLMTECGKLTQIEYERRHDGVRKAKCKDQLLGAWGFWKDRRLGTVRWRNVQGKKFKSGEL